jgi:hypothetical protein
VILGQTGVGGGMTWTNARSGGQLEGTGRTYALDTLFASAEYTQMPNGVWTFTLTGGRGTPTASWSEYTTNTVIDYDTDEPN